MLALLLIAAAVFAAVFFADHPGRIAIDWQGWQIETSVGVLALATALFALLVAVLALLIGALRRLPRVLRRRRAARRRQAGEAALTRGLVALAAGEAAEAQLAARRAESLLGRSPVALLLVAETAQRQGDAAAARHAYAALLEDADTEFLGLRGLLGQALRGGDDAAALRLAERARALRPDSQWLIESLLVLQARAGQWEAALDTVTGATRRGTLPPERMRHYRGVALYELSRTAERLGDPRQAAKLAARAGRLAPDLAPIVCYRARLLLKLGRRRSATKITEHAWRTAPHPDLARIYADIEPEAEPLARVAAVQRLAAQNPQAAESHIAVGEAALAAGLWGEARSHLGRVMDSAPSGPSRRLCLLMARLEQGESGNVSAARDWLDRAIGAPPDPSYVCSVCGSESAAWQPLCPVCGAFDTLTWRTPPHGHQAIAPAAASGSEPLMLPASELTLDAAGRPVAARPLPSGLAAAPQSDN